MLPSNKASLVIDGSGSKVFAGILDASNIPANTLLPEPSITREALLDGSMLRSGLTYY